MWPEPSSVKAVNLVKKICYRSEDIEFFLGDYFFLAHPVDRQLDRQTHRHTDSHTELYDL